MKKRTRHPNHHNNGNRNQQVTISPNFVVISKEEHQRLLASDKTANRIASMHAFNTKFGQDVIQTAPLSLGPLPRFFPPEALFGRT